MQRWLSRTLATTFTALLLVGGSAPGYAESTPQEQPAATQGTGEADRRLNEVTLASGKKAILKVVPLAIAVQIDDTEKSFTAKHPFLGSNVQYRLDILKAKAGEHLVAQVTDGNSVHAWVLVPEESGPRVALEISDVQTVQLVGDLVITGTVRASGDSRSTIGSRIYRYSAASGKYEATSTPGAGVTGGAMYPIPPDAPEDGHAEKTEAASATWLDRLAGAGGLLTILGALGIALAAFLLWRVTRTPKPAPSPANPPAELAVLASEVRGLRLKLDAQSASGTDPVVALTERELTELTQAGLQNPVADLVQSLAQRTELIPFPAAPGQAVRFGPPEQWVITRRWVIAPFHDGRSSGSGLWRFRVTSGAVEWSLLDIERE